MKVKSYRGFVRGGSEIRERHKAEAHLSAGNAFLPSQAVVPLGTGEADQARCLVYPGDRVEECQIIGRADRPNASNVHSPIPGVVSEIRAIRTADGQEMRAVVVELGGSFSKTGRKVENYPWRTLSSADIVHILTEKGVICTGWNPRPIQQMISEMKRASAARIVVNCLDTEPYVTTEAVCVVERPHAMAEGVEILLKASSAEGVVVLHDREEAPAVSSFLSELSGRGVSASAISVRNRYPQGFPEQLREVISAHEPRAVPSGTAARSPIVDPTTLLAIRDAVAGNKPVVERYITVAGEAIKRPRHLKVRIGMKIGDIIEECGGFRGVPERIILNGPMTGLEVRDLDIPIGKTTTALLALSRFEVSGSRRFPCIRCSRCIDVCPEALEPQHLYALATQAPRTKALSSLVGRCTGCGLCGYICPSRLPLAETFAQARAAIEKGGAA